MPVNLEFFRKKVTFILNIILVIITILAFFSLIINLVFETSPSTQRKLVIFDWIILFVFIADTFIRWAINGFRPSYLRQNLPDFILTFLFLVMLLLVFGYSPTSLKTGWLPLFIDLTIARAFIVLSRLYIVGSPIIRALSRRSKSPEPKLAPAQLFIISFIFVILMGTGLLLLPEATKYGEISLIDALFTATSATCVTGLIVVDTGSYFTTFGQLVILILIQIGGLGLMTVTTFFALVTGKNITVRESLLMSSTFSIKSLSRVSNLIISTLVLTFSFEFIGFILLFVTWSLSGEFGLGTRLYYSLFHSVSAFCNAGFSLFSDNLEHFKDNLAINLIVTFLVIFGGLGFITVVNLLHYFHFGIFKKERLTLHTKIVLTVTGALIVTGMLVILITEWNNSLDDLPISTKFLTSYFHSVTSRTAGFNTIEMSSLTNACYFVIIILMFIGASPGGTGGGIKTSTFGIFMGTIWSMLRGRAQVEIFRRSIPKDITTSALLLTTLALMLLSVFAFVLLITEDLMPVQIFFEVFSAFGTVGLSTGITSSLTTIGKLIIITTMFIGRIGPLTLMLAISQIRQRRGSIEYEYPEESVIIG